jgi:hypothetical protein
MEEQHVPPKRRYPSAHIENHENLKSQIQNDADLWYKTKFKKGHFMSSCNSFHIEQPH